MTKTDIAFIMEKIHDLIASIDEDLFNDTDACGRLDAIELALFDAAGIPRPDQSTPDWKLGEEPASRVRRLEEAR
jgi:hypothetical protein